MSSEITVEELKCRLADTSAHGARIEFCQQASDAIDGCGRVLWAFGAAADMPDREGLALVCQAAGELSTATVGLYREERWYAGAALVRQFIECEYLVYLFAQDRAHSVKWRQSTREERLDFFKPAAMRKLSQGKFQSDEYAIHCERGGHPSPMGSSLLAEHTWSLLGTNRYLWCDLGQHLERFWDSLMLAVDKLDLGHIAIIQTARGEFPGWRAKWKERDLLSSWVSIRSEDDPGPETRGTE
ncbi:MAG: hypothetical protein ACKVU4_05345 [Phycisphaerales bacterium]